MQNEAFCATNSAMPAPHPASADRNARLGLAGLIDLELQLADDDRRSEAELMERDREIAKAIVPGSRTRRALLARWVAAIRSADEGSPGKGFERALRRASALLSLSMFAVGVIVAFGIFHFTGDHPINVLVVLGVLVFVQLLTLAISIAALGIAIVSPGFFEGLPLVLLLERLASHLWRKAGARVADDPTRDAINRLLTRRSLYDRVERYVLFRHLQLAAAWFNVGALTVLLIDVTVTDLAFGWSTTLQLGAESFLELCQTLAAPWSKWLSQATPTFELVRATQYFRLEGAYVGVSEGARVGDPALSGQWWPFLASCLFFYGLLPRVVLAAWSSIMVSLSLRGVSLDTPDVERLVARLTGPSIRRIHGEDPGNVTPLGAGLEPVGSALGDRVHDDALGVLWREAQCPEGTVGGFLRSRYQLGLQGTLGAAGGSDFANDERLIERINRDDTSPVLIVSEPWTVPDAAFKRLVASIRAKGKNRPIVVALTEGGSEEDTAIWAGYLAELRDPYLFFERENRVTGETQS